MSDDRWLAVLRDELRRGGVFDDVAEQVVAEASSHLRDSGQPAAAAFGSPRDYAGVVAGSLWPDAAREHHRLDSPSRGHASREGAIPAQTARGRPCRELVPLLDARGVSKRFGRRTVLDGVDLQVRGGEVAAVVGANGCGKSTLLRICAGLSAPDAGQVTVRGTAGYCPQNGGVNDFLLPDEHFVLLGAGRGMSRHRSRRAGRATAAELDWDASSPDLARHLSGGTRQKLNLVLASLGDPDLLLLDEPYQGFDRGAYLDFWSHVWRWRERGKAVVVVTHLLAQLEHVDFVLDLGGKRS